MKRVIRDLALGQKIIGRIEEILDQDEVLICFDGDLLRVHNETRRTLRTGDQVALIVTGLAPLRFRIAEAERTKSIGRFNVSV